MPLQTHRWEVLQVQSPGPQSEATQHWSGVRQAPPQHRLPAPTLHAHGTLPQVAQPLWQTQTLPTQPVLVSGGHCSLLQHSWHPKGEPQQ